ncbi:uncharacterized protein I303_105184 [Kwoniella dejecticola CBS 10117]|uniref:Uncharacterized protein n=1 Tax=Kwoniella dejecticola CBS 10117 TaxID=1296121 RepID=A0A1A6A386_9TREE|nr:uncharacterized protein I303_05369 [Kwoniella dejecticola CBS 10117]OBR84511.1 hypothetical protein I303_05369 [Kwoniella dejecticola CBS 10117]
MSFLSIFGTFSKANSQPKSANQKESRSMPNKNESENEKRPMRLRGGGCCCSSRAVNPSPMISLLEGIVG